MADLLQTGRKWFADVRTNHASQTIEYRRGNSQLRVLAATPGLTDYQSDSDGGPIFEYTSNDWIVRQCDLQMEPQKGDRIKVRATGEVFEVLPTTGGKCFREDPNHIEYRIFTTRITPETV